MKYHKFVPNVPGCSRSIDVTGNTEITPLESTDVPDVPDVPEKGIDTYTHPCVCVANGGKKKTHHTKRCKGGALVSETGNTGTLVDFPEVERVPGTGNNREQNREQIGNKLPLLPPELWVTGIATFGKAWEICKDALKTHIAYVGMGEDGYYVAAFNSGLCAVRVPHVETEEGGSDFEVKFYDEGLA